MQKKDLTTGMVLTFLFGPLGMLYTSIVGFVTFVVINIFLATLYVFSGSNGGAPILFIVKLLELYWTYNVLTEKIKRIDNRQMPMTQAEEFDLGFKNTGNALLVFLGSIFFTCCIYALLSLTHIIDKTSNTTQGFIFFIVLIAFLLILSFGGKDKKIA